VPALSNEQHEKAPPIDGAKSLGGVTADNRVTSMPVYDMGNSCASEMNAGTGWPPTACRVRPSSAEEAMKLEIGQTVQLKSGGPEMTIVGIGTDAGQQQIECAWSEGQTQHSAHFPPRH
jgi:uncharacterized protein YodC (DUF2158 family)